VVSKRSGAEATEQASWFAALCADDRAFSAWYETALPRVYGFISGRTGGDASLAEDVTALAFLEAIRARRTFDGRSDPVTWICSIARNRLIDHYRAEARDRTRHLRLIVTDLTAQEQASWNRLDDRDAVLALLAALPSLERTGITLRYLDGYSVRETARLIGRTESATESLLMRARDRIRAAFPGGFG
jgi:RNA polymerase sigma-70 factor, ECF subfamily